MQADIITKTEKVINQDLQTIPQNFIKIGNMGSIFKGANHTMPIGSTLRGAPISGELMISPHTVPIGFNLRGATPPRTYFTKYS